jgi:hypothetical protein
MPSFAFAKAKGKGKRTQKISLLHRGKGLFLLLPPASRRGQGLFCFFPLFFPMPLAIGQEVQSNKHRTFASRLPTRAGLVLFFVLFLSNKNKSKSSCRVNKTSSKARVQIRIKQRQE